MGNADASKQYCLYLYPTRLPTIYILFEANTQANYLCNSKFEFLISFFF